MSNGGRAMLPVRTVANQQGGQALATVPAMTKIGKAATMEIATAKPADE